MIDSISRRDFLKASSAAGLAAVALSPMASLAEPTSKVRVVIAKDTACMSGSAADPTKVQAMIDNTVKTFTGKMDTGLAYAALFPTEVSTSTKIMCKRNDVSGRGAVNKVVTDALKKGLSTMIGATFPAANVNVYCSASSAVSAIQAANYMITCPVAWMHGSDYGVTLSLKNSMNYRGSPSRLHSTAKTWLHNENLSAEIKPKLVGSLLDAIVGNCTSGPGGSSNFTAHSVIFSSDIVAVDYNALRIMEKQSGANTRQIATGDSQLKAAETAGLGTCTPAKMDVINISPPWNTGIMAESMPVMQALDVQVLHKGNLVEFVIPAASSHPAELAIFEMSGKAIWYQAHSGGNLITWNTNTMQGSRVPAGMYLYSMRVGGAKINGTLMVSR